MLPVKPRSAHGSSVPTEGAGWAVRDAQPRDAAAMRTIYNEAVERTIATFDTRPRSLRAQQSWIEAHLPAYPVLVVESDDTVCGWASLSPWSERLAYRRTVEESIYIRSEFRGRGLGRELLGRLLATGDSMEFHTVLARIALPNPASVSLHRRMGFRPIGTMREVGFKFDRFIDVALWQRFRPSATGGSTL